MTYVKFNPLSTRAIGVISVSDLLPPEQPPKSTSI